MSAEHAHTHGDHGDGHDHGSVRSYLTGFVLSVILALPIPFGNIPPALAICLMALGILEQDGWWIVAGLITAAIGVAIVSGVLFAMFETALFVGNHVF